MEALLRRCCLIVLLLLDAAACSSSKVRVDQAMDKPFTCKTFNWRRAGDAPESFTEQRVRNAALRELEKKGYRIADKPDCEIAYAFETEGRRTAAKPRVGVGVGGGSGGLGGGIGVSLPVPGKGRQSGEFSLDIIDVASNSEIWHGSVETTSRDRELTEREAAELVERVLAKLPSPQ